MEDPKDLYLKTQALTIRDRLKELHEFKQFHKFQLAVFNAIFVQGKKRIFIRKGRKGGGTETALYPLARIAATQPDAACYIIGPTQRAQSEIIWDNRRLHKFLPHAWNVQYNQQEKRARLNNGSFIKVEGANDPEAARGWEGDIFVWDEYKDQNPLAMEACYPNVLSRNAIWIVLGSPPTNKSNHYYQKEQEIINDPDWAFFKWTAWDNPFLPGGHEFLKKERAKYYQLGRGDLWETEYEAEYVFDGAKKVIPSFSEKNKLPRNVIMPMLERDKHRLKWFTAIDPGYATCFAALFGAYNPYTGQVYWLDEIYSKDRKDNSARRMWPLIESKQNHLCPNTKWINIYDSAALSFAVEVIDILSDEKRKAHLAPTVKQKGDEENYFRTLNGLFAIEGQSYVAFECKMFIREIEDYETDANDNYPDKNNHLLDDARYIVKYLGVSTKLKQVENEVIHDIPEANTIQSDIRKNNKSNDFAGYGGEDAAFDIREEI